MKWIPAAFILIVIPALSLAQMEQYRNEMPEAGKRTLDLRGTMRITYPQVRDGVMDATFRFVAHHEINIFRIESDAATVLAYEDKQAADSGYWTYGKTLLVDHSEQRFSPLVMNFFPHAPQWMTSNIEALTTAGRWTRESDGNAGGDTITTWSTPLEGSGGMLRRARLESGSDGVWHRYVGELVRGDTVTVTEEFVLKSPLEGFKTLPSAWTATLRDAESGEPYAIIEGAVTEIDTARREKTWVEREVAVLLAEGMDVADFGLQKPLTEKPPAPPAAPVAAAEKSTWDTLKGKGFRGAIVGGVIGLILAVMQSRRRRRSA